MSRLNFAAIVIGLSGAVITVSAILYKKCKNRIPTSNWQEIGIVTQLFLYPLKSGRRTETHSIYVDWLGSQIKLKNGLTLRDRCFTIYNATTHLHQASDRNSKILQLSTSYNIENGIIQICAPDTSDLQLDITKIIKENQRIKIGGFGIEPVFGIDCGDEAATWISSRLTKNEKPYGLRLAFNDASHRKTPDQAYQTYINEFPFLKNSSFGLYTSTASILLLNEASIVDLNSRIENSKDKATVNNFRPNIVIGGGSELAPYAEDNFKWIKIGETIFQSTVPCGRCLTVTINPENGVHNEDCEPLKTLRKYRQMDRLISTKIKSPAMGLYLDVKQNGTINVGDKIYIQ